MLDFLNTPATPKKIAFILTVIVAAIALPAVLVILFVGNTSVTMPLWVAFFFWGNSLLACLLFWRYPQGALFLFAMAVLNSVLPVLLRAPLSPLFWPARLFLGSAWPAMALAGLWIFFIGCIIWVCLKKSAAPKAAQTLTKQPSQKKNKLSFAHLIFLPLLTGALFIFATNSIENIFYLLANQTKTRELVVTEKTRTSKGIYLVLRDKNAQEHTIELDDFYRREVKILANSDPTQNRAMRLCWNQAYLTGDLLVVKGRASWLGFAIDHVEQVVRDGAVLCQ